MSYTEEKFTDDLRSPNFLQSLIYRGSLQQVRQAVKFLSEHEVRRLFSEVLSQRQEVPNDD